MGAILYGLRYITKHNVSTSYAQRRDFIREHGQSETKLICIGVVDSNLMLRKGWNNG